METLTGPQRPQVRPSSIRETLNQKGEATLFCVLILVVLSGLLTLSGLELQRNFSLLKKRTHLFLCAKEAKGELNLYMKYQGRLNWLIKNTSKAQLLAVLIPPLWPHIGNADKLKKVAKSIQVYELLQYEMKLADMKRRGCPLDPRMFLNPYKLGSDFGFERTSLGAAKLRSEEWTYYLFEKPYLLTLKVNASATEAFKPFTLINVEEKGAMLSSHLSSAF